MVVFENHQSPYLSQSITEATFRVAHEQPVLFSYRAGTDGVLDEVVVYASRGCLVIQVQTPGAVERASSGGVGEQTYTPSPRHVQGKLATANSKAIPPPINSAETQIMSALLPVSGEKVVVELHG